jgi:hypothetical protein
MRSKTWATRTHSDKTIAAAINEAVAPLRKRIESLEMRATMADHLAQFEARIPQLEASDPAPTAKTLKLVHDGHG